MRTILLFYPILAAAPLLHGAFPFLGNKKKSERESIFIQDEKAEKVMERGLSSLEKGNQRTALGHFKTIYKKFPNSKSAPEALFQSGNILLERKSWKKSFEAYYAISRRYPDFENYNKVLGGEYEIASALTDKSSSHYFGFVPYRNFDSAARYFEAIVAVAPYSEYAPLSLMNIAIINQKRGNELFAIDALDRLINTYPKSMLASDAYLKLAQTFSDLVVGPRYDQGATREAIKYFEDYLILFPESPDVAAGEAGLSEMEEVYAKSKLEMGEFYYKKRKNYTAAEVFFNEAVTVAPNSSSANKAHDYLAVIDTIPEAERMGRSTRRRKTPGSGRGLKFWKKKPETEIAVGEESTTPATPPAVQTVEVAKVEKEAEENPKKGRKGITKTLIFWKKGQSRESPVSGN